MESFIYIYIYLYIYESNFGKDILLFVCLLRGKCFLEMSYLKDARLKIFWSLFGREVIRDVINGRFVLGAAQMDR